MMEAEQVSESFTRILLHFLAVKASSVTFMFIN